MKKNVGKKMLVPTLQEIELVPITDPTRLAAIDRRRRAVQKAAAAIGQDSTTRKSAKRK